MKIGDLRVFAVVWCRAVVSLFTNLGLEGKGQTTINVKVNSGYQSDKAVSGELHTKISRRKARRVAMPCSLRRRPASAERSRLRSRAI